jgi:ketosteroid isomerase-like protein
MNKLICYLGNMKVGLLVLMIVFSPLFAFSQEEQSGNASAEKTLIQIEQDWSKAFTNKDVKTLERILGDDYIGIDFEGKPWSKAQALEDLQSGKASVQSYELAPFKVRFFGNIAVVNGSQVEKSNYKGKDTSGNYIWTTVYINRDGRWQAVASQSTKVVQ